MREIGEPWPGCSRLSRRAVQVPEHSFTMLGKHFWGPGSLRNEHGSSGSLVRRVRARAHWWAHLLGRCGGRIRITGSQSWRLTRAIHLPGVLFLVIVSGCQKYLGTMASLSGVLRGVGREMACRAVRAKCSRSSSMLGSTPCCWKPLAQVRMSWLSVPWRTR